MKGMRSGPASFISAMRASMKILVLVAALFGWWSGTVHAQTPAQPADPNTPIPAQPVQPPPVVPAVVPDAAAPPPAAVADANAGPQLTIIADGSLKAVLSELAQTWADRQDTAPRMSITLTNAGTMRAKIESGGVWDLALDADLADVKALTGEGHLLADGQRSLARNTLVVIGRAPLVKDDDLDWFDLIGTEWKKVAMGNPDLTVSGRRAQHALGQHGLLDRDHRDDFASVPNEAAGVQAIRREQADAAFVFKTDLAAAELPGFQSFPVTTEDAPPIFYTGALLRLGKNGALARAFLDFISSPAARPIWMKYGFETD